MKDQNGIETNVSSNTSGSTTTGTWSTTTEGTYTIIDSDPGTWSTNIQAGNRGIFKIEWHEVQKTSQ